MHNKGESGCLRIVREGVTCQQLTRIQGLVQAPALDLATCTQERKYKGGQE